MNILKTHKSSRKFIIFSKNKLKNREKKKVKANKTQKLLKI